LQLAVEVAFAGLSLTLASAVYSQSFAVPRLQPHRRSGLATLPSVGAVP